jgi:hypothetical protein
VRATLTLLPHMRWKKFFVGMGATTRHANHVHANTSYISKE